MSYTNRYYDFYMNDDVRLYNYHLNDSSYTYLNGYSLPLGSPQGGHPNLYGHDLTKLCKKTQANISRLKKSLTHVDPCYEYGPEHWHFDKEQQVPEQDTELADQTKPTWKAQTTMFTTQTEMNHINWRTRSRGETKTDSPGPINKFCYLCTTLEEHQRHLARRGLQLKAKQTRKPRVDFIVPLPGVKESRAEVEEKKDNLYKITVRTGSKTNAATTANVFIKLKGEAGKMKPRQLKKRTSVNFSFGRGTTETFYMKTPTLGTLHSLVIYHDGLEKKDSWFLEDIEVLDVTGSQMYVFLCRQWLSLHVGDCAVRRELRAQALEKYQKEFWVSVFTGNKALAGTDAHVTMMLCGKKGCSRKLRLSRTEKKKQTLQRGVTDNFTFVVDDIGFLSRIRIEHNNNGKSPDWLLEKILIEDSDFPDRPYLFPCGEWIPADDEQDETQIIRDLYPIRDSSTLKATRKMGAETEKSGTQIMYDVTVVTGDVRGAGTDANVYLMIMGKLGKTRDVLLDDNKNNFERGMTDKFKIHTSDVGAVKKIRIRHDNTSLAAGWFLDKIILKRFFTKDEVGERMNKKEVEDDDRALRRASEITGIAIKGRDMDARRLKQRGSSGDTETDDSESEEDSGEDRRRSRQGRSRKEPGTSAERTRKSKGKTKSKYTYGGIDTWVTDSDSEDSRYKGRHWRSSGSPDKSGRRHNRSKKSSQSDDSEDDKKAKKKKDRYKSKFSDSDYSDGKKSKKRGNKKRSKYIDSESSDDEEKYKKQKSGKSKHFEKDSSDYAKKKDTRSSRHGKYSDSESSDSSSTSDTDGKKKKRKDRIGKGRRKVGQRKDSDSDEETITEYKGKLYDRWREDRAPFCDEYEFICRRWLATDEDDKRIDRELKPNSVTTFYRKA